MYCYQEYIYTSMLSLRLTKNLQVNLLKTENISILPNPKDRAILCAFNTNLENSRAPEKQISAHTNHFDALQAIRNNQKREKNYSIYILNI